MPSLFRFFTPFFSPVGIPTTSRDCTRGPRDNAICRLKPGNVRWSCISLPRVTARPCWGSEESCVELNWHWIPSVTSYFQTADRWVLMILGQHLASRPHCCVPQQMAPDTFAMLAIIWPLDAVQVKVIIKAKADQKSCTRANRLLRRSVSEGKAS